MLSKYWPLIIIVFLAIILFVRWIFVYSYPVQLINDEYRCVSSICNYEYQLVNSSSKKQVGQVLVKTYKQGGIKTNVELESVNMPYKLAPKSKMLFSGSVKSYEIVDNLKFIHASK